MKAFSLLCWKILKGKTSLLFFNAYLTFPFKLFSFCRRGLQKLWSPFKWQERPVEPTGKQRFLTIVSKKSHPVFGDLPIPFDWQLTACSLLNNNRFKTLYTTKLNFETLLSAFVFFKWSMFPEMSTQWFYSSYVMFLIQIMLFLCSVLFLFCNYWLKNTFTLFSYRN